MDDLNLRLEFHRALDPVAPPAPWLAERVSEQLQSQRQAARTGIGRQGRSRIFGPTTRRLIAAALVLVIAGTAAAAAIAIYERSRHVIPVIPLPGPVTRACAQGGIQMVDKNTGWNGTTRTTDGGKTWKDVSPPPVPGASPKGPGSFCGFDANHAWALTSTGTAPYQPAQLVVLSTGDGGQSWQQLSAIAIPFAVSWRINFSALLDFFDAQHGWLFMAYATQPVQRRIYATVDSGITWTLMSRQPDLGLGNMAFDCSQSGLMFDSVHSGWLTWDCSRGFGDTPPSGSEVMAGTNDGGRTWAPVQLPSLPSGSGLTCSATSPIFTGAQGVVQVNCSGTGRGGSDFVYSTVDGGVTWTPHPLSIFTPVDFINGTTGFYVTNDPVAKTNTLYRTTDGGAHWTVAATGLFPGVDVGSVTFLDEKTGFADVGGPSPWWTYDGGKTWSLPPPYHSVGYTVCPLFSDPGAGSRPVAPQMFTPATGWAGGARRTVDGGATWTKVSPPLPKSQSSGYGEFYLDATHAWVAETTGSSTSCADRFVVYSTSDGGATWQAGTSIAAEGLYPDEKLAGNWTVSLEFIDPQTGWLNVRGTGGLIGGHGPGPLYKTVDGGRTWTLFKDQASWSDAGCSGSGLPYFSSPTTGWLRVTCSGTTRFSWNLLVTRDGGQTWTDQELVKNYCGPPAYPDGCPIAGPGPKFFDASNGWIFDAGVPALLTTTDGGQTWTQNGLPLFRSYTCQGKYGPTTCADSYIQTGTFLSPSQGWLFVADYSRNGPPFRIHVERTLDGGRSWSVLFTRNISGDTELSGGLTFVDQINGFWWLGPSLLRTIDGGRTWTPLHVTYS